MHVQGYTQVRGPLARLSLCTCRVTRRCAGLWPAFRCARAGLRSGARASGPPFDIRTQMRRPLARLSLCTCRVTRRCAGLWPAFRCARAGLHAGARASGSPFNVHAQGYDARASSPPVVGHSQGYTQVREPLARLLMCTRKVTLRCAGL